VENKLHRFSNLRNRVLSGETQFSVEYEKQFYRIFFRLFACEFTFKSSDFNKTLLSLFLKIVFAFCPIWQKFSYTTQKLKEKKMKKLKKSAVKF